MLKFLYRKAVGFKEAKEFRVMGKERKCDEKKVFEILAKDSKICVLENGVLSADFGSLTFGYRFESSDIERCEVILCGIKKRDEKEEILLLLPENDEEKTVEVKNLSSFCVFRDTRVRCAFFETTPFDDIISVSSQLSFAARIYGEDILTDDEKELLRIGEFAALKESSLYYMSAFSCEKCAEYAAREDAELASAFAELSKLDGLGKRKKKKAVEKAESRISKCGLEIDFEKARSLCERICENYEKAPTEDFEKLSTFGLNADKIAVENGFEGNFPKYVSGEKYIVFKPYCTLYSKNGKTHFYDVGVTFGNEEKDMSFKSDFGSDILPLGILGGEEVDVGVLMQGMSDILNGKKPSAEFEKLPCVLQNKKKNPNFAQTLFFGLTGLSTAFFGAYFAFFGNCSRQTYVSCIFVTLFGVALLTASVVYAAFAPHGYLLKNK